MSFLLHLTFKGLWPSNGEKGQKGVQKSTDFSKCQKGVQRSKRSTLGTPAYVLGLTSPHQIYTTLNFFTFLRAKVFFNGHQKRQFSTFTLNLDQNERFSCLFVLLSTYLTWAGGGRGGGCWRTEHTPILKM